MSMALNTRPFSTLVTETQRIFQDTQSTTLRAACKDAINRALDAAASLYEWPQLFRADESGLRQLGQSTLTTFMAADSYFPAPFSSGRLKAIVYKSQYASPIEIVSSDELYARAGADLAVTGKPQYAAIVGKTAQVQALAADGALTCTSSSSSNDNSLSVRVYFQKSTAHLGQRNWTDVSGTFSTGVSLAGGVSVESGYPIMGVSLPAGWAGSFNIQDGSGNVIAAIQSAAEPTSVTNDGPTVIERALVKLWPTPDANYPCSVMWWRVPALLVEDADVPEIPVASFLVAKAASDIFGQQGKAREAAEWDQRASTALMATLRQNTGTKRLTARPYGGNIINATGSSRW